MDNERFGLVGTLNYIVDWWQYPGNSVWTDIALLPLWRLSGIFARVVIPLAVSDCIKRLSDFHIIGRLTSLSVAAEILANQLESFFCETLLSLDIFLHCLVTVDFADRQSHDQIDWKAALASQKEFVGVNPVLL